VTASFKAKLWLHFR